MNSPAAHPDSAAPATAEAPPTAETPARPIRFFHRGRVVSVEGLPPTTTVLQWLREQQRATGTKEGCNEGDCGACTVIVAERAAAGATATPGHAPQGALVDGLLLRPVNACIRYLPTLDGRALLTVEDLQAMARSQAGADATALHPVQQALVDCHGSQCGFCTPGFAMTLTATYERHAAAGTCPSRRELADDLAGNLCRCTGYRPILDAGQRMFQLPAVRLDPAPIRAALDQLAAAAPLHYRAPHADGSGRPQSFAAPRGLAELAAARAAAPQARLLAGGTDIGLWTNKQFRDLGDVIWIGEVGELRQIERRGRMLRIGAAVPLADSWAALAAAVPALTEMGLRFAGPPVRHAGTLVGNLANGSPIGDTAPVLMSLGATLALRQGDALRELPLEDFYLDYMKNALREGEFVQAVTVELPPPGTTVRAYKLSKRYDCDISAVAAGMAIALDAGGRVQSLRLAYGGMAATVKRAAAAEAAALGQPWTEATARAAMAALAVDFKPLADLRASAAYRARTAANLLLRFWHETRADAPLPPGAASVWQGLHAGRSTSTAEA